MSLNFGKNSSSNNTPPKENLTLDEVLKQKRDAEEKAKFLEERAIMLRCPDRKCRVDGCEKLGTHVIVAIQNPLNNIRMEYSGRYSDSRYIGISDRKNLGKTEYNRMVFKPLMFLCDDHTREQIDANGGELAVAKMRDNILKGVD